MGYIIKNGISYFGDNAVELTQAEYDALPSSKLTDGVDYYITDAQAGTPLATEIAMSSSDSTSVAEAIGNLSGTKIVKKSLTAVFSSSNISANLGNAKTLFELGNDDTIDYIGSFCNGQPLVAFTNSTGGLFCGAVLGQLNATYGFTAICFYH